MRPKLTLLTYALTVLFTSGLFQSDFRKQIKAEETENCWGKVGEKTTYLDPYCPANAPEIPYGLSPEDKDAIRRRLPMTPEDALTVVMSDGCTYRVYYKESVRMRAMAEYKTVFEPMEQIERVPVEEFNPYTGQIETRWIEEKTQTTFPVLHEKEIITYEPEKILLRVIIPGTPSGDPGNNTGNGSAELHFGTEITPKKSDAPGL